MLCGFSFCGTDVSRLGLSYAPDLENTFVYRPADSESHVESYEGHSGGYYYGSWYKPKEFSLRCYFEEKDIDKGILDQAYSLFKVGRAGRLVFTRRPWCYYDAVVTEPMEVDLSNYRNGTITAHLKAMYPFARSDIITNTRAEKYHNELMSASAVFDKVGMDTDNELEDIQEQSSLVIANPGPEPAALGISIAGDVGDGVIITNRTTGQSCKLVAISKAKTTDVNKYVLVDPISGKTIITDGIDSQLAFLYHEYGFLTLASSYPAIRDVYINYYGGNSVEVSNILNQDVIGKYIFVKDKWHKIVEQESKHTLKVSGKITSAGAERSMIIPMNEITITPVSTMDISNIKFIFKPTYT